MQFELHNLIGRQITYNNQVYILIEIMGDEPLLIFQCQSNKEIQRDQHGNAHRKSLPTFTLHCLNEAKTDLHPTLKEMLNGDEYKELFSQLKGI